MNRPGSFAALRHALLAGAALALLAGCTGGPFHAGTGRLNATEKMMWSTYPLGTEKGMATGFVVARRDPNAPGGVVPIMVTSLHVLSTVRRGPLLIGVRLADERGAPQAAVVRLLPPRGRTPFYVRHPQHDIAAFVLEIPPDAAGLVTLPSFLTERTLLHPRAPLRAGAEVSFLGFPEVLPGTAAAFPILRNGRVASYPVGDSVGERKFLINADVYPGDSGAPVFVTGHRGRPELAGMIIQRIGTDRRTFSHLAIAVDTGVIRETLQLLAVREAAFHQGTAAKTRR